MIQPRFDVSIAAHYVPSRVGYLAEAMSAIAQWERPHVSVTLVTNDLALADEPAVIEARTRLEARGFEVRMDRTHGMEHPFHLTWWHKAHMREWYERPGHPEDLFMYIEDDMVVTAQNIRYFEKYLPATKQIGCIPGFLRYEVRPGDGAIMSTDSVGFQIVPAAERRQIEGQDFIAPLYPYWAGFIMDRDLAAEYFASPWSDRVAAAQLPRARNNSCRVHSAWALSYHNVPQGMPSRYVVPVDAALVPLEECLVWHSPNNYSVSNTHNFGMTPMTGMFRPDTAANRRELGRFHARRNAGRFVHRVRGWLRRGTARLVAGN